MLWVVHGLRPWVVGVDAMLLLGVKSFFGVPWLINSVIGCGFVVGGGLGGDIKWMASTLIRNINLLINP